MNYLASPPLVVAYALAGTMESTCYNDPLGHRPDGKPVYLRDIWPPSTEVSRAGEGRPPGHVPHEYGEVYEGDEWNDLATPTATVRLGRVHLRPPAALLRRHAGQPRPLTDITGARVLARLGDSVTTDHISPAGHIKGRQPGRPVPAEHGVAAEATSTPTAPAAATTRS